MISVITIDGPSGSGKGTVSRLVASTFGFQLLDSGALYRLTALACLKKRVDVDDEAAVAAVAAALDVEFLVGDVSGAGSGSSKVLLEGEDVTKAIRSEDVGMNASVVAALPQVRQALLERQRAFAHSASGLVADGRDMGTVVFPNASAKVFLTASAEERAQRRVKQLQEQGDTADYVHILRDIQARDERDSTRAVAPLMPAPDALLIDSTGLGIEDVLELVVNHARQHLQLK